MSSAQPVLLLLLLAACLQGGAARQGHLGCRAGRFRLRGCEGEAGFCQGRRTQAADPSLF